ncbi:MAG: Gfo/Idh/MocA family oxidoreductase [Planctomycetota bacterium]
MSQKKMKSGGKPIRLGVVGVGRGRSFARGAATAGMELVALCDTWEEKLNEVGRELGVTTYTDFGKMLEHDLDAVVLANYFHQHAPLAIQAMAAGKHVMSECASCFTLAEGVALIRAVEKSRKIYMIAENYPYSAYNQEMRRLYQAGKIGEFVYGEGEYVHCESADVWAWLAPGIKHWRGWLPATYYCTHALAPLMFITDTRPVKVNSFIMPCHPDDPVFRRLPRFSDAASMIVCRMDNGAWVKLLQVYLRGHGSWVRVHGSRGHMENMRFGDRNWLRLNREQFHEKKTGPVEQIYRPEFPAVHQKMAKKAGHGGGDYFTNFHFAEAIRKNEPPYLDVYRGVAMSIIGPLGYRAALQGGVTLEVPDFRKEAARKKYENDHWAPDPFNRKKGDPWPSITGKITPSKRALAYARNVWRNENKYFGE